MPIHVYLISYEEAFNDDIFNELKVSPEIADIEVKTVKMILLNKNPHNFFEPFPSFFLKDHELRKKAGFIDNIKFGKTNLNPNQENKNLSLLEKHLNFVPPLSSLQKYENNEILKKTIKNFSPTEEQGNLTLKLLQYIFTTNKNDMIILKGEMSPFGDLKGMIQILIQPPYSNEERKFQQLKKYSGSEIVFHGTSNHSVYSILRNGLVVLSNTHMMKVGATYGPGIYCTRSFYMAFNYTNNYYMNYSLSNRNDPSVGDDISSLKTIFGIECIKDSSLFINTSNDTNGILVAKERNITALRYLFIMDKSYLSGQEKNSNLLDHYYETLAKLQKKKSTSINQRIYENKNNYYKNLSSKNIEKSILFQKKMQNQEKENLSKSLKNEGISQENSKRLLNDFTLLYNSKELMLKSLKIDKTNMMIWKLIFECQKCKLFDIINLNHKKMKADSSMLEKLKIEIQFFHNYPKEPPFIRLISPRIAYHPGIIGIGGCFCIKELTNCFWQETMDLEHLLLFLLSKFCDFFKGVDSIQSSIKYTREEAMQSFNRISIINGWIKTDYY